VKVVLFLFIALHLYANEALIEFYHTALKNLQYDKKVTHMKKRQESATKALQWQRFGSFSMDLGHTKTKADRLINSFDTTDIALSDSLDIFGKQSYQYDSIALQYQEQKTLLDKQKEELFISLLSMISTYQQTNEILALHIKLYKKQKNTLDKLSALTNSVSRIDILRLQNSLTLLQTQIIDENHEIQKMIDQLQNYVPNSIIPDFKEQKQVYNLNSYLHFDTDIRLNDISVRRLDNKAKGIKESFLPTLNTSVMHQNINDPTANGDNYSFTLSINIPIDTSAHYENEALKSESLSLQDEVQELQVKRKNDYLQHLENIDNANKQLAVLMDSFKNYQQIDETIRTAFLKRYVDFNTYIQTVSQTLSIQEQIIRLTQERNREIAILNGICSGVIYE
jgi:hypothetical protein